MKIETIPFGWYSDISIRGDKVSLIRDSHIELNGERIELPGENVLFLRMDVYNGIIYLAGQGNQSGVCWLWNSKDGVWDGIQGTFGVNPCAFSDVATLLYTVVGNNIYRAYDTVNKMYGPDTSYTFGSQGIRCIQDGRIITGDETYGPSPYNIAQFTPLPDVAIGQSYTSGVLGVVDGVRHQLALGNTEFIRAYQSGEDISFCFSIPGVESRFYWMTLDELKSFPIENAPPVIPPVIPPIVPPKPIPPKPVPPKVAGDIMSDQLKGIIYCIKVSPNPDYPLSNIYTLPYADERVFACLPDGTASFSPKGSKGPHETGQQTGNVAAFQPQGNVFYSFAVVMVDKLWP